MQQLDLDFGEGMVIGWVYINPVLHPLNGRDQMRDRVQFALCPQNLPNTLFMLSQINLYFFEGKLAQKPVNHVPSSFQ